MATDRDTLDDFVPRFTELNGNVLSGQVQAREEQLSPQDRDMTTVTALMTSGVFDTSLRTHIEITKSNGITCDEMVEILTRATLYAGWLKARTVFRYVKGICAEQIFTVLQRSTPS